MTETARRLRRLGAPHARARAFAMVLGGFGAALAAAALGLALAPAVPGIALAWALILVSAAAATRAVLRTRREAAAPALGRLVESAAGGRAGSIVGVVTPTAGKGSGSSAALLLAADTRAAAVVSSAAPQVDRAMLLAASAPNAGQAAAFWHPMRAWRDARTPIRLTVDRTTIPRGGNVFVTVIAPAATQATLWSRGAGEPWRAMKVGLDRDGKAVRGFMEINADLYLRASTGGRRSGDIKVSVALPLSPANLDLPPRFPSFRGGQDRRFLPVRELFVFPA